MRQGVVVLIIAIMGSVGFAKTVCEEDLERALRMRPRSAINYADLVFNQRIVRLQNLILMAQVHSPEFRPEAIEGILLNGRVGQNLFAENLASDELRVGQRLNVLLSSFYPEQDSRVKAAILPWLHNLKMASIQN